MESQSGYRCPNCGYEYESWVEVCPDCNVPLVQARPRLEVVKPGLDPDTDPQWTIVANMPNAIIGRLIKSQLEDAGIPVLMMRSSSADIAQFSGNDYVPQDLRVPLHLVAKAREIIDAPPGNNFGPSMWQAWDPDEYTGDEEEANDEDENEEPAITLQARNLPEGWSLLPSEADIDARQVVKRTHGEALKGWYWTDGTPAEEQSDQPGSQWDDDSGPTREPLAWKSNRQSGRYETGNYDGDGGYGLSKWTRVIYGILILIMTLPFILQILERVWSMMWSPFR